jgi:hypothetical protein
MMETARVTPIEDISPYFHPALHKGLKMCNPGRKKMRNKSKTGTRNINIGKNINIDHKTALLVFSLKGSESVSIR